MTMSGEQQAQQAETNLTWPNLAWLKTQAEEVTSDNFDEIDRIANAAIEDLDASGESGDVSKTSIFNMLRANTETLAQILDSLGDIRLMLRATLGDTDKTIVFPAGTVGPQQVEDEEPEDKEDKE